MMGENDQIENAEIVFLHDPNPVFIERKGSNVEIAFHHDPNPVLFTKVSKLQESKLQSEKTLDKLPVEATSSDNSSDALTIYRSSVNFDFYPAKTLSFLFRCLPSCVNFLNVVIVHTARSVPQIIEEAAGSAKVS